MSIFTNIFGFLSENRIVAELKLRALDVLKVKKAELKALLEEYLKEKSPVVREVVIGFIMDHIELKFPYKFFKGSIRKVLVKNFDRLAEFLIAKLQEI